MKPLIDQLVDRFLSCPLPESVCSDLCVTRRQAGRSGTALLSGEEAKTVLTHVLGDLLLPAADERERIIQVLIRTNPTTVEDRTIGNPFTDSCIAFMEPALREVLTPKP